tara:strand:- start:79 stop:1023 length:945 start_codon:yes stop_codon:yes gene_type:complete
MTTLIDKVIEYIGTLHNKSTDKVKAEKIKDFILNLDCKDNTKSSIITKTKHHIINNKIFNDDENLIILNATDLYERIIKANQKYRKDEKKVVDVDMDNINKILNLKCDKPMNNLGEYKHNIYSLYSYLLFTSGLRQNEIWDNQFTIIDKYKIKPKRLSKQTAHIELNDAVVNLLIPSTEWINYFNILQTDIKNKGIKYGSTLFSGIARTLEKINPELTGHSLRKLYVAYHQQILNTDPDKLPSVSTARLLNHQGENASTYYTGAVKITGELKDVIDRTDYTKYTIAKLKDVLKSNNINYTSKMKKAELLKLLNC